MLISKDKEKRKTENALSSTNTVKKNHVKLWFRKKKWKVRWKRSLKWLHQCHQYCSIIILLLQLALKKKIWDCVPGQRWGLKHYPKGFVYVNTKDCYLISYATCKWDFLFPDEQYNAINQLLTPPPPRGLIYFKHIWGGEAYFKGGGGLFNLAKTMVLVLHEELKYKVESLSTRRWRSCSRGSKTNPNFQLVNKPSRISPHKVLQLWLINTVQHLLVKNDKGEGRPAY